MKRRMVRIGGQAKSETIVKDFVLSKLVLSVIEVIEGQITQTISWFIVRFQLTKISNSIV